MNLLEKMILCEPIYLLEKEIETQADIFLSSQKPNQTTNPPLAVTQNRRPHFFLISWSHTAGG